jgi:hypothetical protein
VKPDISDVPDVDPLFVTKNTPSAVQALIDEADAVTAANASAEEAPAAAVEPTPES